MLNRLKISLVLGPIALMTLIGVYIYTLWTEESRRRAELPIDATSLLCKDLQEFHKRRGSFPLSLNDLEGIVWEEKERNYDADGRALIHRNYYYLYTKIQPHGYALWGIPLGRNREEALTIFVFGTSKRIRNWKGPMLDLSDIKEIPPIPTPRQLVTLGLSEQEQRTANLNN